MNPRGGFVALRREQATGIDPVCESETEPVGYQETWTKKKMNKDNDGRLARNERAAPDRSITLKESLQTHTRHGAGGRRHGPYKQHAFQPRNHQRPATG